VAYQPYSLTLQSLRNTGNTLQDLSSLKAAAKEREARGILSQSRFNLQREQILGQNQKDILGAQSILNRQKQEELQTERTIEHEKRMEAAQENMARKQEQAEIDKQKKWDYQNERVNPRQELATQWTQSGMPVEKQREHFSKLESALGPGELDTLKTREEIGKIFQTSMENMQKNKDNAKKLKEHDYYGELVKMTGDFDNVPETDPAIKKFDSYANQLGYVRVPYTAVTEEKDQLTGNTTNKTVKKYTVMRQEVFDRIQQKYNADNQAELEKFTQGFSPQKYAGKTAHDPVSDKWFKSDGKQWVEYTPGANK
jgi:hypothetical protein